MEVQEDAMLVDPAIKDAIKAALGEAAIPSDAEVKHFKGFAWVLISGLLFPSHISKQLLEKLPFQVMLRFETYLHWFHSQFNLIQAISIAPSLGDCSSSSV